MRATVPTEANAILGLMRGLGPRVHVAFEEGYCLTFPGAGRSRSARNVRPSKTRMCVTSASPHHSRRLILIFQNISRLTFERTANRFQGR
jgi:hypothetical protein